MTQATPGRIVHYTLTPEDAAEINKRRSDFKAYSGPDTGHQAHYSDEEACAFDLLPAIVIQAYPDNLVRLQVFLRGNDTLYRPSVRQDKGDGENTGGTWDWPPQV